MGTYFLLTIFTMTFFAMVFLVPVLIRRSKASSYRSQIIALLPLILIPVTAGSFYAYLGRPDATRSGDIAQAAPSRPVPNPRAATNTSLGSVESLLEGLVARLNAKPDDADGWLLLARSYRHLERADDARAAYEKAVQLGKTYSELADYLDGNKSASTAHIRGRIALASGSAERIRGDATVFIVAKSVSGSAAPLAVRRIAVSELPYEFELGDKDSMVAGNALSTASEVLISARISKSGEAMRSANDTEVLSPPVKTHDGDFVDLVLDPASPIDN